MIAKDLFMARTRRERVLISGAGLLAAVLGIWLAGASINGWRVSSEHEWRNAARDLDVARGMGWTPSPSGQTPNLIRAEAEKAGVVVDIVDRGGQLDLNVASAPSATMFRLLQGLDQAGRAPASVTIVENADATLQMQASYRSGEQVRK